MGSRHCHCLLAPALSIKALVLLGRREDGIRRKKYVQKILLSSIAFHLAPFYCHYIPDCIRQTDTHAALAVWMLSIYCDGFSKPCYYYFLYNFLFDFNKNIVVQAIVDIPYASPPQGMKYFTIIGPHIDCMEEQYLVCNEE